MGIENFKKNLRYLRRKHGFSQPFIAEYCEKKNYTTIQRWETGETEPSLKDVYKLAELYDVDLDDFVKQDLELLDATVSLVTKEKLLPDEEKMLIKDYRKLNNQGKERVQEQIDYCLSKDKFLEEKD